MATDEPRAAWVTVVVLGRIGFTNYVLLRLYSTRGLYCTACWADE